MSNDSFNDNLSLQATIILTEDSSVYDKEEILNLLNLSKDNAELIDIRSDKTQSISVEQIREIIIEAFKKNINNKIRVFFLLEADKMKDVAQNSLLKILEETPPEIMIVLFSRKQSDILQTIISRSRIIKLKPKNNAEINVLDEDFLLDKVSKPKSESKQTDSLVWKDKNLRQNMLELQCLSNKLADSLDEQKLAKLWLFSLWLNNN